MTSCKGQAAGLRRTTCEPGTQLPCRFMLEAGCMQNVSQPLPHLSAITYTGRPLLALSFMQLSVLLRS